MAEIWLASVGVRFRFASTELALTELLAALLAAEADVVLGGFAADARPLKKLIGFKGMPGVIDSPPFLDRTVGRRGGRLYESAQA
jgi:hypothetical protein